MIPATEPKRGEVNRVQGRLDAMELIYAAAYHLRYRVEPGCTCGTVAFCPVHDAHVVRLHAMLARTLEASRQASLEALQAERRAKWEEIDARHEAEEVAANA